MGRGFFKGRLAKLESTLNASGHMPVLIVNQVPEGYEIGGKLYSEVGLQQYVERHGVGMLIIDDIPLPAV